MTQRQEVHHGHCRADYAARGACTFGSGVLRRLEVAIVIDRLIPPPDVGRIRDL